MKESTKRKLSESHTGKHLSTEKRIERNKKRVFNKEKE